MDLNKNKSKDIICTKEMSRSEFLATMSATFSFVVGGTIFGRFLTDAEAQEIAKKAKGDKTDAKTGEHKPKNKDYKKIKHKEREYNPHDHAWVYLVDTHKCIGCGMCVRACKIENNVPDEYNRTWVERYHIIEDREAIVDSPDGGLHGFQPEPYSKVAKTFFIPKICNHCKKSPCSQVCPVGASYYSPDLVQLIDQERCIGCGYCVQACPYSSRFMNPKKHVADKCFWCYHRITKGMLPACVHSCPTGTRKFGDMTKPDDPIRKIIATQRIQVLRPEMLTLPQVKYLGLDMEVK